MVTLKILIRTEKGNRYENAVLVKHYRICVAVGVFGYFSGNPSFFRPWTDPIWITSDLEYEYANFVTAFLVLKPWSIVFWLSSILIMNKYNY
jgi:hypothetical protein